jgi:two-component system, sensor histidine kinase and response regulator
MNTLIGRLSLKREKDVVLIRQQTKELAALAGLSLPDQTRLVTAVSEIVRNAGQYAGNANVEFSLFEQDTRQYLQVIVSDQGPGIANIEEILSETYQSRDGMGRGIVGARALSDLFWIDTQPGRGTSVSLSKQIPASSARITADKVGRWSKIINESASAGDLLQQLQEQNKLLVEAFEEKQNYQNELEKQLLRVQDMNRELDDTNKGIMALYAELDESKKELLVKTELLEEQSRQLQEATRNKSEFLANMSHEIRTPMNGVMGMTEILAKSGITSKQQEYVKTIQTACRSLLAVINDILDFSKIEAGKLTLELNEFDPARLVEDIAALLSVQAKTNDLLLLTFVDPDMPLTLRGDPIRLRQILMNLMGNAVKFSEHGSVLLRVALVSIEGQFARVKFSVTDPGIGLTEEEINKLFEPFVQGASSRASRVVGTGLGLCISRRLVELMGGKLAATSVKGHGSTFSFCLDLETCSTPRLKSLSSSNLSGLRVLTVDDDVWAREIMHSYLNSWGLRNCLAADGSQALTMLHAARASDPYDLVIIDLVMPEMNGLQLGKVIREDDSLKSTRLLLVTAFDKPGTGEEAIAMGFDAYLTKPVRQSELLNAITTIINKPATEQFGAPFPETEERTNDVAPENSLQRMELILVAEDHPINQEVALLLLKNLGFEAHMACNGQQVLQKLKLTPYSLILMDCQMPELDGFETTRSIRKLEATSGKHIPIVAMTAHAIEGSRDECVAAGMDDYVSKPIDPEKLESVISKWLPRQSAGIKDAVRNNERGGPVGPALENQEPINLVLLESRAGKEGARRLLALYPEEVPEVTVRMKTAIRQRNSSAAARNAHALKGIFGTLCADYLRALAIEIEDAALAEDWQRTETILVEFDCSLTTLEQTINLILQPCEEDGCQRNA